MEGGVLAGAGEWCVERDYVALAVGCRCRTIDRLLRRAVAAGRLTALSCRALLPSAPRWSLRGYAHYADSVGAERAVDGLHQCAEHILSTAAALQPGEFTTVMPRRRQYSVLIWSVPMVAIATILHCERTSRPSSQRVRVRIIMPSAVSTALG